MSKLNFAKQVITESIVEKVLTGVARPKKKGSNTEQSSENVATKSSSESDNNTLIPKIVGKARDYFRSLHAKLNNTAGVLPSNFSLCEGMICVELAFKFLNINQKFDREIAVQQIGADMKDYQSCFTEVVNLLGISFAISLDDLILTFGCQGIRGSCEKLLEEYKKKFESRYSAEILKKTDFTKPILKVAAFYITATQTYKFKVDFKKLAEETKTNVKSLSSVVDSMKETCGITSIKLKENQGEAPKRKRDDIILDNTSKQFIPSSSSSDGLMGFDESKVVLKKKKVDSPKTTTTSLRSQQLLQKLSSNSNNSNNLGKNTEEVKEVKQDKNQEMLAKKTKQTKLNFFK
ncbi:hypothetical protein NAEGRDRAFT_88231 [Naegleria gruberi]|uniref:Origin recognition complex subunit 6 n=1 Tax=Naegleria gruberi TaxID=5762 RepID=D2UXD2_NAEGR|nr:uncharacterized protein NAEGRDRAFT_88231 [Naegleria gruberi]EFC50612.1 hypothetical protein NAEGRDRAFT_88231 [Naegleria gruberi]|eukprot:XP_002683356.1 hypothetical protein NAEGRDRAFT_88231 [Naegleria gruberi strain NEG-M]